MLLPYLDQGTLYDTLTFAEFNPGNWYNSESPDNRAACGTLLSVFRCPSAPIPRHLDSSGIPNRVPCSYLACASGTNINDSSKPNPESIGAAGIQQDGIFFLNSSVSLRDVRDGSSNTVAVGEAQFDNSFEQDNNSIDHWYIGSLTIDPPWGSDFSEFVGSTGARINVFNLGRDASTVAEKELSFGSYHKGGCHFLIADGSVRFVSESIDADIRRAIGTRADNEVVTDF